MYTTRTRVIPCLLLRGESLVKTVRFNEFNYIGDPINTVRIFNELEVDELMFLDIAASRESRSPNYKVLEKIASECFMPLSYGGGLNNMKEIKKIFDIGFEKVVLNSSSFSAPMLITETSKKYGSQAVVASIDYKKNFFGKKTVYSCDGTKNESISPLDWAQELENRGAGELLLTCMDKDGTWDGYDFELIKEISQKISIPLVASGGAGKLDHLRKAVKESGASAVALGNMVVYQKKDMGVLINFPNRKELKDLFNE